MMDDVLRAYRNAAFEHIAVKLEQQYGATWFEDEVAPLFSVQEWAELKRVDAAYDAATLQMPNPSFFERLGVAHLAPVVQKHGRYLVVVPGSSSKPSPVRIDAVVKLAKDVRNVRDPTAHSPSTELAARDLYFYTELARRVLDCLGLLEESEALGELLAAGGHGAPPVVYLEVPPPSTVVQHFVGRGNELATLERWLLDNYEPVSVIAGGGGTGKSALAYQFVITQRQQASRLNFVLWMSAKRRRLIGGTVEPIEAEFYEDTDVLNRLWKFFGGSSGDDVDAETLMSFLNDTPGLIVADDVDSLDGPGGERAKALLAREIPYRTRTKVLLTSRKQLFGFENCTVSLAGFTETEAAEFIRTRLREQDVALQLGAKQMSRLHKATDGVPLYMEDLLRLVLTHDFDSAVKQWSARGGDTAREYALKREFEVLSPTAQRVLLAASQFGEPTSALELGAILRIDDAPVGDAIQELQRLFLMSRPEFVEGVPRFTVPITTTQLVVSTFKDVQDFKQISKAVEYYREQVGPSAMERGPVREAIRTANVLIRRREFQRAEQLLNQALAAHPSHPDLIGYKGYLYKHSSPPRLTDAQDAFNTAAVLHCKNPERYCQWAEMNLAAKDHAAAVEAAELGLKECSATPQLLRMAGLSRRALGNRRYRDMQTESALEEYHQARKHLRGMLTANRQTDPRHRLPVDEAYMLYRGVLDTIERSDQGANFSQQVRDLAREWLELSPGNADAEAWLLQVEPASPVANPPNTNTL